MKRRLLHLGLSPILKQQADEDDGADEGGADRGSEDGGTPNIQRVAHAFVVLIGDDLSEVFESRVEHFGREHQGDANQQHTPLPKLSAKYDRAGNHCCRHPEMNVETALIANAAANSTECAAKLVAPCAASVIAVLAVGWHLRNYAT